MALIKSKEITVSVEQRRLLLECSKCNMKFTLTAIIDKKGGKDWENERYYGAPRYQVLPQASVYFCPYCGTQEKKG